MPAPLSLVPRTVTFKETSTILQFLSDQFTKLPHVQARELIGETLRFLLLIAGSLIGFSCSFYVLFKAGVNEFEPGCAVLQSTEGNSVLGAGLFLLETILGNDNQLDCLRGSRHPGLAAGLMDACEMQPASRMTPSPLSCHLCIAPRPWHERYGESMRLQFCLSSFFWASTC